MYWKRSDQSSQLCVQSSPSGSARFTLAPALDSSLAVACTTLAVSSDTLTRGLRLEHRDPQIAGLELGRRTDRHGGGFRLVAVGTGDDAQRQLEIVDRARERAERAHVAPRAS